VPVTALSNTRTTGAYATLGLLLVTLAWGSTFYLIKDVVTRMPVLDFLALRFVIAALAMVAIAPRAVGRLTPDERRKGAMLGAVYAVAQILQSTGLQHTSASVSGFVTGMYVVFTPLLAGLLLRHRVGAMAWSAVGLATSGLAFLSLRGLSVGEGELLTLAGAALYAVHILGLGSWSTSRAAYGLSTVQMSTIALVCLLAAAPGGMTLPPDSGAWVAVVYTALVAGAFALVVQTWAQAHIPATRAAVVMTMEPVFASLFAVLLGGESLTARMLVGGTLVLGAMYLAELGPRRGADASVPHPSAP
jgi:drug/metabolite transporter (DMT)-like permease